MYLGTEIAIGTVSYGFDDLICYIGIQSHRDAMTEYKFPDKDQHKSRSKSKRFY